MLRDVRVWVLVAAVMGLMSQHAVAQSVGPDPTLVNPSGLGPSYTGPVKAGMGLAHSGISYGIKAGDFIIQPRFMLENEITSNFFKVDTQRFLLNNGDVDESQTREEEMVYILHLRPGVGISNPNGQNVKMRLSADVDAFLPMSETEVILDQTNVGANVQGTVGFVLKRLMTFVLRDNFRRELLVRPLSASGGESHRNTNLLGGGLQFHPGGGALTLDLNYNWNISMYDMLRQLDDSEHEAQFRASWRFLPLNYVFLESTVGVQGYIEEQTEQEQAATGNRVSGVPFKVYFGFSGYLSNRIAVLLRAGYGNSLLDTGNDDELEDFSSFIGDTRVSFRFTSRTSLHVGGGRSFNLAGLGGHLDATRAFVSFEQSIADVVLLHADVGFDYHVYGKWAPADAVVDVDGQEVKTCTRVVSKRSSTPEDIGLDDCDAEKAGTHRQDYVLSAGLLADFDVSRLFGLSLGYRFTADITDFGIQSRSFTDEGGGDFVPNEGTMTSYQGYNDHRLFLTLNLRY